MKPEASDPHRLFLVVLGGLTRKTHVEQHDVRWVVGRSIEDTFPQLCNEWFGCQSGLHIDSFLEVKFIDGYEVKVKEKKKQEDKKSLQTSIENNTNNLQLWFVNIGKYAPDKLFEQHQCGLFVAETKYEAKNKAKNSILNRSKTLLNSHSVSLNGQKEHVDNCYSISKTCDWVIELKSDQMKRSQELIPDWYGYRLIANIIQGEINL